MELESEGNRSPKLTFTLLGQSHSIDAKQLIWFLILINIIPIIVISYVGSEMYPFFITIFLWIAAYILLLGFSLRYIQTEIPFRFSSIQLVSLTIIPRAILLFSSVMISLDTLWYLDFGKFMMRGDMPYADFYFPYPPIFGYFIFVIMLIAPIVESFRVLAIIFEVGIVLLLEKIILTKEHRPELRVITFAYALFPIAIIESGLNGHFESIANIFLLLSIWFLLNKKHIHGGIFLGLSAATKVYAIFLLPLFFFLVTGWKRKIGFALSSIVVGFLTFIPFSIPVWWRGDLLFPGAAMPGLSSGGFFDSIFGFLFRLSPVNAVTVTLVGAGAFLLIGIFMYRRSSGSPSTKPLTYDILTISLAILVIVLALIGAVYPFTSASFEVYWRYPGGIALVRGLTTIFASFFIIGFGIKRWKNRENRTVTLEQKILISSVALMLLLSISRNVFYGWYLLWTIPPLLIMRDRRVIFTVIVCMLLLYPSYTHDNFVNLGYSEDKTWTDDLVDVSIWSTYVDYGNSGLTSSDISTKIESVRGIGEFSVDASQVENDTALSQVSVIWSRNVSFSVTPQTEFVDLVSASWDPTFGRYGDFGLYFEGLNTENQFVNGTLNAPSWSPSNLTYVFWRFAFSTLPPEDFVSEVRRIYLIGTNLRPRNMTLYIDIMYTTEYSVFTLSSIPVMIALMVPNIVAVILLNRQLNFEPDDHL